MDTTAVISLIVVSLAVIIPIIFSKILSKKKNQKFESKFRALGQANNLNISEFEKWNHYAIGIDMESAGLIYINNNLGNFEPLIIDLSQVKSVEIQDFSRGVDTKSGRVTVLDQLTLKLVQKSKDASPVSIEFYNSETDATPNHETEIATKWKKIIDFSLNSLNQNR